jgi:ATP-dependent helicase/nuclease subunit A
MSKPADHSYRNQIVEDLDHSMLVEAGAGSGKTKSLVDRMVALVAAGRCDVRSMAAVTFTRKAAAELQSRFQIELEKAFRAEVEPEKKARFETALQWLDHLFAGTIHSFCSRLLRERPIEAGLDPDFQELEEDEDSLLRDRCWSQYLDQLFAKDSSLLSQLDELGLSEPSALQSTYAKLCLYPEVEVLREAVDRPDFNEERALLDLYLHRAWKRIPKTVPEKGWDRLQTAIRKAYSFHTHLDPEVDRNFIRILTALETPGVITQNRWAKGVAKEEKTAFDEFKEKVVLPCLKRWRQYCHPFIMDCVLPGVNYFQSVREKHSLMNFQDLLLRTAELLRDHPTVREYFQKRFTHILIDEFQDTDPIQAEVLLYLTGEDRKERSWQKTKVLPGALFIVGDPKQSIYRFRRADIDTYNQVKGIIEASGGRILRLTTNFRSLPSVCHWVNPVFEEKFPSESTQYQAAFEKLTPYRKSTGGGVRKITLEKTKGNNPSTIASQDAGRIASWIDRARRGRVSEIEDRIHPGDVMILLRYKTHLPAYARELEALDIPYEISGGGAFGTSEELRQLLNLLRAVAEPGDPVALVAALRGQFFGISDNMLYRFRSGGGRFSYLSHADRCKDEEVREALEGAFEQLRVFHSWAIVKPAGVALSLLLDRTGILPLTLTREGGESRAGNLMKALELTFGESSGNTLCFSDTVERLRQYCEDLEIEEMSIQPGKPDAVKIMNLHKAKGLEARVVFLAEPYKEIHHPPQVHIARKAERASGYFVALRQIGEFQSESIGLPPQWERYEELESLYRKAEEDRLLYVAATRARELLVVSTYPEKSTQGAWKKLYPFLTDVKELDTAPATPPSVREGEIHQDAFPRGQQEILQRRTTCAEPSYETESVTHSIHEIPGERPFLQDTGTGMSWGRIIHQMLEAAARDEGIRLDLLARNLLREEERPLSETKQAIDVVTSVMSSTLWQRMKTAEQTLIEVPFMLQSEDGEVPRLTAGAIDLVFKEPDGWVIVEYKTDTVAGRLNALVEQYRPQVEMYRQFWKVISGEPVKEAGVYFIDTGVWIRM